MKQNKYLRGFLIFLAFVVLIGITFIILKQNQERITKVLLKRTSSYDDLELLPWDFKVMTFHINHSKGSDGKNDVQRISDIIKAHNPAIVCLTGVDMHLERSRGVDQARKIAALTGMQYTFSQSEKIEKGWNGNAVLTRYPIYFSGNKSYKIKKNQNAHSLLHVVLLLNEQKIHVFNTELSADTTVSKQELHQMVDYMNRWNGSGEYLQNEAVIVAGTLNMDSTVSAFKELDLYFRDVGALLDNPPATYPAQESAKRFDYIFINNKFTPISGAVIDNEVTRKASTHLPFLVHLKLKPVELTKEQ